MMIANEQLRLRALEPSDVDTLYQWENQMELWVVSNTIAPFSKFQLQKYIKHASLDIYQTKQLRLMIDAVVDDTSFVPVGMIDLFDFDPFHLRAGVGVMVHSPYRNKGLASQALGLFVQYCFNRLGLHQLYCSISVDNLSSIALFEKQGFKLIGIKKDWCKSASGFKDEAFYQLIRMG